MKDVPRAVIATAGDRGSQVSTSPSAVQLASPERSVDISRYFETTRPLESPGKSTDLVNVQQGVVDSITAATAPIRSVGGSYSPRLLVVALDIDQRVSVGITLKAGSLTETSCHCRPKKSVEYHPLLERHPNFNEKQVFILRTLPERHVPVWGLPLKNGAASLFCLIGCVLGKVLDGLRP